MDIGYNLDFSGTVEEFLKYKPIIGYNNNLNAFSEYLKYKGINDQTIRAYLQGIQTINIIESLRYYIKNRGLTSIVAAQRYISCIKEYILFIIHKEYIVNKELSEEIALPAYSEQSFRYQVNKAISECKELKTSNGSNIFSREEVIDVIHECDVTINSNKVLKNLNKQMYYNKFRSAVLIKLILLTGITYRSLRKIQYSDVNIELNKIQINGLSIHLPDNLSKQIKKYIGIRSKIVANNVTLLFVEFNGEELSQGTSAVSDFLVGLTSRGDLNGLIKYAVESMIIEDINKDIIIKLTGIGDKIYNACLKEVDINASRYIDSKIRSMEIYDIL